MYKKHWELLVTSPSFLASKINTVISPLSTKWTEVTCRRYISINTVKQHKQYWSSVVNSAFPTLVFCLFRTASYIFSAVQSCSGNCLRLIKLNACVWHGKSQHRHIQAWVPEFRVSPISMWFSALCCYIYRQQGETHNHPWKDVGILISSSVTSSEELAFFNGQPEGEAGEVKWVTKLETNVCFFKCWNTSLGAWGRQTKCSSLCLMQRAFY